VTLHAPAETVSAETLRAVRWPGRAALVVAILTVVALAIGMLAVSVDQFAVATFAAWAAIGLSGLAVVGGIVAAIGNWDRGAAIAAIIVGALANPLVLLWGLNTTQTVLTVASA